MRHRRKTRYDKRCEFCQISLFGNVNACSDRSPRGTWRWWCGPLCLERWSAHARTIEQTDRGTRRRAKILEIFARAQNAIDSENRRRKSLGIQELTAGLREHVALAASPKLAAFQRALAYVEDNRSLRHASGEDGFYPLQHPPAPRWRISTLDGSRRPADPRVLPASIVDTDRLLQHVKLRCWDQVDRATWAIAEFFSEPTAIVAEWIGGELKLSDLESADRLRMRGILLRRADDGSIFVSLEGPHLSQVYSVRSMVVDGIVIDVVPSSDPETVTFSLSSAGLVPTSIPGISKRTEVVGNRLVTTWEVSDEFLAERGAKPPSSE